MSYETIGIIAGILSLAGYIPYIHDILYGSTRPNRSTWLIWTLVGGLLAASYIAKGDLNSIWMPLAYFIGPMVIAILSLRYGYAKWTRLDTICVIAALVSLLPWLIAHDVTLTLIINLIIDIAGAIPTLVKTYREPKTEELFSWFIFFIATIVQFFAIRMWNIAALYPVYLFLLAGIMLVLIIRGKIARS